MTGTNDNSDDDFPPAEVERRVIEMVRRCTGQPATFDFETGQNIGEPKLSAAELKARGYPCAPWWRYSDH